MTSLGKRSAAQWFANDTPLATHWAAAHARFGSFPSEILHIWAIKLSSIISFETAGLSVGSTSKMLTPTSQNRGRSTFAQTVVLGIARAFATWIPTPHCRHCKMVMDQECPSNLINDASSRSNLDTPWYDTAVVGTQGMNVLNCLVIVVKRIPLEHNIRWNHHVYSSHSTPSHITRFCLHYVYLSIYLSI